MASASPAELVRLLLRRSDLHPIGALDGRDLAVFEKAAVDRFIEQGILVERAGLQAAGDLEVQVIDGAPVGFSPDGQEVAEEIDPRALGQYEIDMFALCIAIRRANGFAGAPVERLSHRLYHLGEHGAGGRRRLVFLARLLRENNALDTVLSLRGRAGRRHIILLTPTVPTLTLETSRRIATDGVMLVALSEALKHAGQDLLAITIPAAPAHDERRAAARLVVDTTGYTVVCDGKDVSVARREFDLLVVLANEAATEGGFVDHNTLYAAIQGHVSADGRMAYDEQIAKSVSLLRKALAEAARLSIGERKALIETKRKVGYRLGLKASEVYVC